MRIEQVANSVPVVFGLLHSEMHPRMRAGMPHRQQQHSIANAPRTKVKTIFAIQYQPFFSDT